MQHLKATLKIKGTLFNLESIKCGVWHLNLSPKIMNSSTLSSGTLSHSTGQRGSESPDSELTSVANQTSKILNQMKSELQEQKQKDRLLREQHLKRVQSLRKELDYIKATEWRYQPIDRYIQPYSMIFK